MFKFSREDRRRRYRRPVTRYRGKSGSKINRERSLPKKGFEGRKGGRKTVSSGTDTYGSRSNVIFIFRWQINTQRAPTVRSIGDHNETRKPFIDPWQSKLTYFQKILDLFTPIPVQSTVPYLLAIDKASSFFSMRQQEFKRKCILPDIQLRRPVRTVSADFETTIQHPSRTLYLSPIIVPHFAYARESATRISNDAYNVRR